MTKLWMKFVSLLLPIGRAYTMTNHDGHKVYHDGQSNENVKNQRRILLRNCQIRAIVGQISPRYVFGRHGLWPSLSNPVVVVVMDLMMM